MNAAATCVQDFFELIEHKDSIIGRDLQINELGMVYRGPISDIRLTTGNRVIITLEWVAYKSMIGNREYWRITHDRESYYEAPCDTVRSLANGSIVITVPLAWRGVIQPAGTRPLPRPVAASTRKH